MRSHQPRRGTMAAVLTLAAVAWTFAMFAEADEPWAGREDLQRGAVLSSDEMDEPRQDAGVRIVRTSLLFWADGMAVAPELVFVHEHARSGLLAHEAVHCRQMREIGLLRFWWWYLTSPDFRLEMEAEAYRVSLQHEPGGIRHFARALARGYLLGITEERAERLLRT